MTEDKEERKAPAGVIIPPPEIRGTLSFDLLTRTEYANLNFFV